MSRKRPSESTHRSGLSSLTVAAGGLHLEPPGWTWSFEGQLSYWNGFILGVAFGGEGALEYPGALVPLSRGTVYLLKLHAAPYVLRNCGWETLSLAWVYFRCGPGEWIPPEHSQSGNIPLLEQLMLRTVEFAQQAKGHIATDWFRCVLHELRDEARGVEVLDETELGYADGLERLCRMITSSPGKRWRLPDMAKRVGLSPPHFTRIFRRYKGMSPKQFLILSRIEAAKSYLRDTERTVAQIAELLGYADPYAFSHQFKNFAGVSPLQFRKQLSK